MIAIKGDGGKEAEDEHLDKEPNKYRNNGCLRLARGQTSGLHSRQMNPTLSQIYGGASPMDPPRSRTTIQVYNLLFLYTSGNAR